MKKPSAPKLQAPALRTPTDLKPDETKDVAVALNGILADVFALYLKTKNFHWHMSGPHFRDYHVMLDEQADQIYAMADPVAERIRKRGLVLILSDLFDDVDSLLKGLKHFKHRRIILGDGCQINRLAAARADFQRMLHRREHAES